MTQEWIFFEEGNESSPEFEVEANSPDEAFNIAYETWGPWAKDLYYKIKPPKEQG